MPTAFAEEIPALAAVTSFSTDDASSFTSSDSIQSFYLHVNDTPRRVPGQLDLQSGELRPVWQRRAEESQRRAAASQRQHNSAFPSPQSLSTSLEPPMHPTLSEVVEHHINSETGDQDNVEEASNVGGLWSLLRRRIFGILIGPDPVTREGDAKQHKLDDILRCPILLDIMRDPVVAADGHTYDRQALLRWLQSHNSTSPITRQPLSPDQLYPNRFAAEVIAHYWRNHTLEEVEEEI